MSSESPATNINHSPALHPATENISFLQQIIETQNDVISVELDHPVLMQMIAERTRTITAADGAIVELLEGAELICYATAGAASAYRGTRIPVDSTLSGHCAKTGNLVYCEETRQHPLVNQELAERIGIHSMIVVPLTSAGKTVGVLKVVSLRPNAFSQQSILALRLMAGLLGSALAHSAEFRIKAELLAERTTSLAALRDSEERFRSSFDHAAIGMALVSLEGRFLQVNRSLCKLLGRTGAELLAIDFQSITHPDDLHADLALSRRLVASEIDDYQMIKRYVHKLGHLVWTLLSVSLVRDAAGAPLYFISQIQDITERHAVEEELRRSEEEFRAMFELSAVGKMQSDLASGRFLRVNRKFCEITGYSPDEALTLSIDQITHPDDRDISRHFIRRLLHGESITSACEKRYIRKDGETIWVAINASVIRDPSGKPARAVANIQDITRRKQSEWLETDRRKMLEAVIAGAPLSEVLDHFTLALERQIPGAIASFILIADGGVSVIAPHLPTPIRQALEVRPLARAVDLAAVAWDSPGRCATFPLDAHPIWADCREPARASGLNSAWAFPVESAGSGPYGLVILFSPSSRPVSTDELDCIDTAIKLITICIEHHTATRQLTHLVSHDPLTGLPNRVLFEDRLHSALANASRLHSQVGYLLLDFDKFKSINDSFGHQVGDRALQLFAQRLREQLREVDTLARIGGDEFAILLPGLHHPSEAAIVAKRVVHALEAPLLIPDFGPLQTSASIGIACAPADGRDASSLQKRADAALYRAKANGRNGYSV
ncbi:MAG: PAS domain S-box protein [Phycisphaerae bacterium]